MGRNRVVGSPYQVETVTEDFTTGHAVDLYLVDAVGLSVTLDPYAVNGDQVQIQDITNSAAAHPIAINASEGQVILNDFGASVSITTDGGSILLTMTLQGWVPLLTSSSDCAGASCPAPGTPAFNPTWYALLAIYLDPVHGSDANTGATIGSPVKTMAEVVRRFGSSTPLLVNGQSLTIHQLSAQTPGVDNFFFAPKPVGGAIYAWVASVSNVGGTFSPTTVTPKSQGNPGNDLTFVGGLPAGMAANQIIFNATKGSYAKVKIVVDSTAIITQPVLGATTINAFPEGEEDNTWANTDVYQLQAPLICNYESIAVTVGDLDPTASFGAYWIQGIEIPDASGSPGGSIWAVDNSLGSNFTLTLSTINPYLAVTGGGNGPNFFTCSAIGGGRLGGPFTNVFAGSLETGPDQDPFFGITGNLVSLDFDVIVDQINVHDGSCLMGAVHVTTEIRVDGGGFVDIKDGGFGTGTIVWGAGIVHLRQSSTSFGNQSGGTWANCLKVSALQFNGARTSGLTPPVAGTFVSNGVTPVAITGTFPIGATISTSLHTLGGTPAGAPFQSAAQTAGGATFKVFAGDSSTYNWVAEPALVALTVADLDTYSSLRDAATGAIFCTLAST
jgi:hypothetical protein